MRTGFTCRDSFIAAGARVREAAGQRRAAQRAARGARGICGGLMTEPFAAGHGAG